MEGKEEEITTDKNGEIIVGYCRDYEWRFAWRRQKLEMRWCKKSYFFTMTELNLRRIETVSLSLCVH